MNNADKPANPVNKEYTHPKTGQSVHEMYNGLTKREYFAGLAMQGLLASGEFTGVESAAVAKADALLKQLEDK